MIKWLIITIVRSKLAEQLQELESARKKDSESIIEISEILKSTEESLRAFETMPFLNRVKYLFRLWKRGGKRFLNYKIGKGAGFELLTPSYEALLCT